MNGWMNMVGECMDGQMDEWMDGLLSTIFKLSSIKHLKVPFRVLLALEEAFKLS